MNENKRKDQIIDYVKNNDFLSSRWYYYSLSHFYMPDTEYFKAKIPYAHMEILIASIVIQADIIDGGTSIDPDQVIPLLTNYFDVVHLEKDNRIYESKPNLRILINSDISEILYRENALYEIDLFYSHEEWLGCTDKIQQTINLDRNLIKDMQTIMN